MRRPKLKCSFKSKPFMIKSLMTRTFGSWRKNLRWGRRRSVISLVVFVVVLSCSSGGMHPTASQEMLCSTTPVLLQAVELNQ